MVNVTVEDMTFTKAKPLWYQLVSAAISEDKDVEIVVCGDVTTIRINQMMPPGEEKMETE